MKALITRVLDIAAWLWITAIAVMLVTGGGVLRLSSGKLELSQLNAWVLSLGLISLLRYWLDRAGFVQAPLPRTLGKLTKIFSRPVHPWRTTWITLGVASGTFALIHLLRSLSFHTTLFDAGVIQQVLFNTAQGMPFRCDTCVAGNYLSEHLAFALALIAPFANWGESALFVLQSLLMAGGVALILRGGPISELPRRSLLALLVLLCHPALRNSWIWDLREDHLAFLFLSAQAIAAYRGNLTWLAIWTIPALLSKENIAFIPPFLYLAFWIRHRRGAWQLFALSALCGLWILISFKLLFPYFSGGIQKGNEIVNRFAGLGSTPAEVLTNLATHPFATAGLIGGKLFSATGFKYVLALLGPGLALYTRRSSVWLIAALPGILMNLSSGAETQRSMNFHYDLVILPFLLLAMSEGLREAGRKRLLFALFFALAFSGRWPGLQIRANWPSSSDIATQAWIRERVPSKGALGVSTSLYAAVSLRSDTRAVGFPSSLATQASGWDAFTAANMKDRTGLPNRTPDSLKYLLVDLRDTNQAATASRLALGWTETALSPGGRLGLYEKDSDPRSMAP